MIRIIVCDGNDSVGKEKLLMQKKEKNGSNVLEKAKGLWDLRSKRRGGLEKGQLVYRNGREGAEFRYKLFSRCVCGSLWTFTYAIKSNFLSKKKEAKSPAESKNGKEALKIGGKKSEMTQEIRKVKGLGNVGEFPHLWWETIHLSDQDVK